LLESGENSAEVLSKFWSEVKELAEGFKTSPEDCGEVAPPHHHMVQGPGRIQSSLPRHLSVTTSFSRAFA